MGAFLLAVSRVPSYVPRTASQARPGSGCSAATARGLETEATSPQTRSSGSAVLDGVATAVLGFGGCPHTGQTRNGRVLASRRFPSVLAVAVSATGKMAEPERAPRINGKPP